MYRITKLRPRVKVDPARVCVHSTNPSPSQKMIKRRKKLRNLVANPEPPAKRKCMIQVIVILSLLLSILTFTAYYNGVCKWCDFMNAYRTHYNAIVYGAKDYCSPAFDTEKLFTLINNQVLNQPTALAAMEMELRNSSKFVAIALVGTTGIGKTLFAQTLKENFPWDENTQVYSWASFHTVNHKKDNVAIFLKCLSDCGRNLIIIDNLSPEDMDFVQEYNDQAMQQVENSGVHLVVLYVFNVATYTDEQRNQYNDKINALQTLENIKIVQFRKFDRRDLIDCIQVECENTNLTLSDESFQEIIHSIDVERSGCKTVHSKVMMYGEMNEI